MRLVSCTSERGNALVEFIGFAVLAIAPVALFATSASLEWAEKSELHSAASLLARAYYVGGSEGFDQQRERSLKRDWLVSFTKDAGVITVTVTSGILTATARGID